VGNAWLYLLKETPAPTIEDARVQCTDRTTVTYVILDDDGELVPVDSSGLALEYLDGATWRALDATFAPTSGSDGEVTFNAPPAPAGVYDMRITYNGDLYYDLGTGMGTLDLLLEGTSLVYDGDTEGDYGGSATLSCTLTDPDSGLGIPDAEVNFTLAGKTYTATTNATGFATVTITVEAAPGDHIITVTYAGNGTYNPATATAPFRSNDLQAPVADAGPDQTVDEDSIMRFDGSASSDNDPNFAATAKFEWTFTDGTTAITLYGVEPFYVFATPGVYAATLKVTDAAGNSDTDTVTITVRDITRPRADAGPDQVVDEDTVVAFDASGTEDNDPVFASTARYSWTFEDGGVAKTLTGIAPTYTFATPGRYVVTMTATDAAGN